MSTKTKDLERDYQERKAQIRSDKSLGWEKQEKAIKALGDEFHARRRELERSAA
jgi:hypothetical protein